MTDIQRALKLIEKKEMRQAKKAAEKAAAKFGFKLADLTDGPARKQATPAKTPAKKSRPAKYANPSDPSLTWSGQGRQPGWFKQAVAAGTDPKALEI